MSYRLSEILGKKGYVRGPFGSALKRGDMIEYGIPVYEQQNAIYNHRDFRYYIGVEKFNKLKRFTVQTGDVLISCSGTVGRTTIIKPNDPKGIISQALLILRPDKKKVLPEFLKYYLDSKEGQARLISRSHGSVQKNIAKRADVETIELPEINIDNQKKIISILSSLDDKIELNNKINKNLEEMAQALYKQWFVDFEFPNEDGEPYKSSGGEMIESELGLIPKGWTIKAFKDISSLMMGLSPKGNSYNEDGEGTPLINGAADYTNGLLNPQRFTSAPTRVCKKDDLVFCIRATIGNIVYADKEYCLGRGVAAITPLDNIYKGIIWHALDDSMKRLINGATGSVILGLKKNDINELKVTLPEDRELLKDYYTIFQSNMEAISLNRKEIIKLIGLRDTLLPKLMSGEIEVPIEG